MSVKAREDARFEYYSRLSHSPAYDAKLRQCDWQPAAEEHSAPKNTVFTAPSIPKFTVEEDKSAAKPIAPPDSPEGQQALETHKGRIWWVKRLASVLPSLAAISKVLKDGFGSMTLYSFIVLGSLRLTADLLSPWLVVVVGFVGISLIAISLGMEGKSLRERILKWGSQRYGVDITDKPEPLQPVKGAYATMKVYLAIAAARFFRLSSPWTAAVCKGISGAGSCAGCLLLILTGVGVLTTTAIVGPLPWLVIGFSSLLGITLALVSRYKEGDDLIELAKKYEEKCWARLSMPYAEASADAKSLKSSSLGTTTSSAPGQHLAPTHAMSDLFVEQGASRALSKHSSHDALLHTRSDDLAFSPVRQPAPQWHKASSRPSVRASAKRCLFGRTDDTPVTKSRSSQATELVLLRSAARHAAPAY